MKHFTFQLLDDNHLEQVNTEDGRYYLHPLFPEKFESVTTILEKYTDQSFLDRWRKRVGEEEATRISEEAAENGTILHKLLENYILDKNEKVVSSPFLKSSFSEIKSILNKNVSKVYGVEHRLFSRRLRAAGTSDLICEWNNVPTIVDFKTARKDKQEDWIVNYFIQTTAYAIMVHELYNIFVPQIVIIMAVNLNKPIVFKKSIKEFVPMVKDIFITKRKHLWI